MCHNGQGLAAVLADLTSRSEKDIVIIYGASIGKKVENCFEIINVFGDRIKGVNCVQNLEHPRLMTND